MKPVLTVTRGEVALFEVVDEMVRDVQAAHPDFGIEVCRSHACEVAALWLQEALIQARQHHG